MPAATLETLVADALTKPAPAIDVASLVTRVTTARDAASAAADQAERDALSPLASADRTAELRRKSADSRFEAERLDTAVTALREREVEMRAAERETARAAAVGEALAERDDLAATIARRYPAIVGELTAMAKRIVDCDATCARLGIHDPSAEAIGRGLPSILGVHRITDVILPMPDGRAAAWSFGAIAGMQWPGMQLAEDITL